jgi:oligopeptide transport system substrate-binding protein
MVYRKKQTRWGNALPKQKDLTVSDMTRKDGATSPKPLFFAGLNWKGCISALIAPLLLLSCMQGESNVSSGNRNAILHLGNGAEPQTLDPHVLTSVTDNIISRTLYEGLVTENPYNLQIEPGVAKRWEYSADRKIITFYLNPLARWSNGDTVTAHDFVWSFERSLNPRMGGQVAYQLYPIVGAQAYNRGQTNDPETLGIKALNDHTLRMRLVNPTPYFLSILSGYIGYPVHRPTIEEHGDIYARYTRWTRPENFVGNGPFTLKEWKMQRYLSVEKNQDYWDADNVALNEVIFHAVESSLAEEKMFRVGQLHFTSSVPLSKIPRYSAMPDSPYHQAPQLGTYFYMFNTTKSPVDDKRVRLALAMSIDRQRLIDRLLHGSAIPSPALTPMTLVPGYTPPDLLRFKPDRARELLAQAGYPNGEGWPGLELTYNTSEDHRKIAVAVQQMWKKELNIKVTLVNQEWKVFLDTLDEMSYKLARLGWLGGHVDPTTFLESYTSGSGINRTGFSSARYDEIMLELAPAELAPNKRMTLLLEAETILMDDVSLVPFYTYNSKHLIQPSVKGMPSNVLDNKNFKYISLDASKGVWKDGG